jgi:hypothetical protein
MMIHKMEWRRSLEKEQSAIIAAVPSKNIHDRNNINTVILIDF